MGFGRVDLDAVGGYVVAVVAYRLLGMGVD